MVLFPAGTGQPCPWTCYPLPRELLPGPADAPGMWFPGDEPPGWPGQAGGSHCPPSWCFLSPRLLSLLRRAVLSGACTRGCLVPLLPRWASGFVCDTGSQAPAERSPWRWHRPSVSHGEEKRGGHSPATSNIPPPALLASAAAAGVTGQGEGGEQRWGCCLEGSGVLGGRADPCPRHTAGGTLPHRTVLIASLPFCPRCSPLLSLFQSRGDPPSPLSVGPGLCSPPAPLPFHRAVFCGCPMEGAGCRLGHTDLQGLGVLPEGCEGWGRGPMLERGDGMGCDSQTVDPSQRICAHPGGRTGCLEPPTPTQSSAWGCSRAAFERRAGSC